MVTRNNEAQRRRPVSFNTINEAHEVVKRLRHLLSIDIEQPRVHPERSKTAT